MKKFAVLGVLLLGLALAGVGAVADALYVAFMAKVPAVAPKVASLEEAYRVQDAFVARLSVPLGPVVGYKVGLTSQAVQRRFGVNHPLRGQLLRRMLLKDGAQVPARFGARPIAEADLLVRVKDAGINEAKTIAEVWEHLDAVIPFIELPDLLVRKGDPLTAPVITAINVGARLGVMGAEIPTERLAAGDLAAMNVRVYLDGEEVMAVPGKAILGHPLNAVLWLVRDLKADGKALKPGDLVSLGSLGRPLVPRPGTELRVVYAGLFGNQEVRVRFR